MNNPNRFYVYRWIRLDTNTPFYVGKGTRNRWKSTHGRSKKFHIIRDSVPTKSEIFIPNLQEDIAFAKEREFIKLYKSFRYCEANMTDGGEGPAGAVTSPETKLKQSLSHKGRVFSDTHKENLKKVSTGRKMSAESIEKTRISNIGRKKTPEVIEKTAKALRGRKRSAKTTYLIVMKNRGQKRSPEAIERMSKCKKPTKKVFVENKNTGVRICFNSINDFLNHFKIIAEGFRRYRLGILKRMQEKTGLFKFLKEWNILYIGYNVPAISSS